MANYKLGNGDTFDVTGINDAANLKTNNEFEGTVRIKTNTMEVTNANPSSNQNSLYLTFRDKNSFAMSWFQHTLNTAGESFLRLRVLNKNTSGTSKSNDLIFGTKKNGDPFFNLSDSVAAALLDAIGYKAGDSFTLGSSSYVQLIGGIRSNDTLIFTIPLSKPVASGVTAEVSGSIILYHPDIVFSGSNHYVTVNLSNLTLDTPRISDAGITVRGSFNTSPSWSVSQYPLGIQAYGLTVTFSAAS